MLIKKFDQFVNESFRINEEVKIPDYLMNAPKMIYCKICHTLSDDDVCRHCKVLNVLGIDKEHDKDNVYGQIKTKEIFFKKDLIPYIDSLKNDYNLTNDQMDEIKNILKIN